MIVKPVAMVKFIERLIVMVMAMLIVMLIAPTYVFVMEGVGFPKFLSHEKYRELAKVHGDVLKLDVVLTLHTKSEGGGWTR